jgi:uncharacterized protein with GYD domain
MAAAYSVRQCCRRDAPISAILGSPLPPVGTVSSRSHANTYPVATYQMEKPMLFISSINWTEQGIRSIKDAPKRAQAARDMAKKMGVEIKEIYLTSGDTDMVAILETANGDNVAKFAMVLGAMGNIRTRTARAWTQAEMQKLISELP